MKNLYKILLLLFIKTSIYAQFNQLYTTEHYNDNVNTSSNFTRINLFDIDYNGEKIPIILSYCHNGIKLDEQPNSLGLHWKIENIGYIKTTVNHQNDFFNTSGNNNVIGWFYSLDPDFSNASDLSTLNLRDYSPDFFSVNLINKQPFDFFYKKDIQSGIIGTPIPILLSNPDGYKINTNFSNYSSTQTIFNVFDKKGNNYDFITGPYIGVLGHLYTDYYLKSLTNPNNQDFININYILSNEIFTTKGYKTGYNTYNNYTVSSPQDPTSCQNTILNNYDYDNNIVRITSGETYDENETRLNIKTITSNKVIVDFVYTANNEYLDEINITDLNSNYITGYKFIYKNEATTKNMLFQIKKYNTSKTQTQTIYEFDYYSGYDFHDLYNSTMGDEKQQFADYMGYYNDILKENLLPFAVRHVEDLGFCPVISCDNIAKGDFEPNINWAKSHSLFRIKNKFSGITEFDYQLNNGIIDDRNVYGGGVVISSKKRIPVIGKTIFTTYTYETPTGFVLNLDDIPSHYMKEYQGTKYYSSIPKLIDITNSALPDLFMSNIHKIGNNFSRVTESNFDFSTMSLQSSIIKEYIPNYEGIYRGSLIKREIFKNSLNQNVKIDEYSYNYQTIETINSAELNINSSFFNACGDNYILRGIGTTRINRPIYVNRVNLTGIKEETFSNNGSIVKNTTLNYTDPNSKILRSKTRTSTLGNTIEEWYYYPGDSQVATEPFVTDLITNNSIGTPLKTEIYRNTEKLSEEKTIYAKDATTNNLLLPKYIYDKKGTDTNSTLEKKITCDFYDDKGNLIQYTQENSVPISLIWGYNKTQLLAKIENATYASISASLITSAQTASDTGTETSLITALNSIRNSTSLANAMVTSYTHRPLVGISTTTDPKGYTIYYNYDTFGRLLNVKDASGNIIEEKEYHLIPQI